MQATLAELAALVGGQIIGDGELLILGAATLRDAEPGHVTLVDQVEKAHLLGQCRATAVVAPRDFKPSDLPTILVDDVHLAFAAIVRHFCPPHSTRRVGVSSQAVVSPTAEIGNDVDIYPFATIGDGVVIGDGSTIHSGVQVMAGSRIGDDVTIFPNAVLYENTRSGRAA